VLLLKQISVFSLLIGVIAGLVTPIPFIGTIVFTLYFIALSAGIIVYLKKNNILGDLTIKEGGIIGAVIGFSSFIAFSCVFVPLSVLISFLFNSWAGAVIRTCFSSGATFVVLLFLMFFVAILCALMNCFSGAVTVYVYEVLAGLKRDEDNFQNYVNK
ncbi:MAG: hypothetical protein LUB59_05920, partial [Candidatus Gastranaerophilales bacterium]|nr:hypothetical protein [Candidatus Gastranaerophilales bacterium]